MARVPSAATAFTHRDKRFMFTAINAWLDPRESEEQRAWTEQFWQDLRPHADGVYMNFLGDEGEERIREAYSPATYRRLAALKARYDPTNFFHLNQNIKPAIQHEEQSAA
jgi:FAD/FMN-containing dehydrogenase